MIDWIFIEGMNEYLMFHLLDWASTNKRGFRHYSYGVSILVCYDAEDHGFYLKDIIKYVTEGE